MGTLLVVVFGLVIGSFLNVCVYRLPLGKSVVWPGSACPKCGNPIKWFDNIPVVSFLALRGRCRHCGAAISFRYLAVELLTPLAGLALLWRFGPGGIFGMYWLLSCILIVVVFIDIEHGIIPDVLSLGGIAAGFLLSVFVKQGAFSMPALLDSGLGILAGGASMFLMGYLGEIAFRKESLGGGDVKLMAMAGAFLGWKLVLLAFFLAPVLGAPFALYEKFRWKKETVPYGPYLAMGILVSVIFGIEILAFLFPLSSWGSV